MPSEEDSASSQAISEVPAKNLRNLTLSPSTEVPSLLPECSPNSRTGKRTYRGSGLGLGQGRVYRRRRGVRTLATARKEWMQRMLQVIRSRTLSLLRKDPQERKTEVENHNSEDLDVTVIVACIMEILLIILAWRIITTWRSFSHKPCSGTVLFLASNFRIIMQQLGKATLY